jgi:hypothetical protein
MKKGANIRSIASEGCRVSAEVRAARADRRAAEVVPLIRELQAKGLSLSAIARTLTRRRIRTPRGRKWQAVQVSRMLARVSI